MRPSANRHTSKRDQQVLTVLSLHLLQAALVYVNTLMIQDILAEPAWAGRLTAEDKRGVNLLFTSNMTPYGEVKLNMTSRLDLAPTAAAAAQHSSRCACAHPRPTASASQYQPRQACAMRPASQRHACSTPRHKEPAGASAC
ncbi:MAG: transposase [Actinobacteria bacterium]|nr:transposase [Actinomycetota bacterium]